MRVDHLAREDALGIRDRLSAILAPGERESIKAYVLEDGDPAQGFIRPDQAIEIRNRKGCRLCLLIPAGFVDAAASSLVNSFAAFGLEGCFENVARELLGQLSDEVRSVASEARSIFRGAEKPTAEQWVDYLSAVLEAPSLERGGTDLWRIGLIPDVGGEGLAGRLKDNLRCVRALVRPARAQSSATERLANVGLRHGAIRDNLLSFFEGRRLRDSRVWLRELSQEPHRGKITFECWPLVPPESDLEAIEIDPFLDASGQVEKYTRLSQPQGPGGQLYASVGPKGKVTVKWESRPKKPEKLKRWGVELIPSREEYSEEEVSGTELPSIRIAASKRKATIPLDIDVKSISVRAVQVRVVGLDEHDGELRRKEGTVIEGLSGEFWLTEQVIDDGGSTKKRDTVPTLPFARLKAAIELREDRIDEAPGQWTEREILYYSIILNGSRVSRIGLSPALRRLEERCLQAPEDGGRYSAQVEPPELLETERHIELLGFEAVRATELGITFLARRKELFRLIQKQGQRGFVETAGWDQDLASRARAYCKSYRELLNYAVSENDELLAEALSVDTLHLTIKQPQGASDAVIILPTHPLRILWYSAYSDLLRSWEEEILKSASNRRRLLDLDLVERVAPLNCPAFVIGPNKTIYLFAQNLRVFWGIALPAGTKDPARRVADVARVVGLPEDEASLSDLPPSRIANELQAYREVHPYLQTLRMSILNPGAGGFVAEALRALYESAMAEEEDGPEPEPPPRLEILAHIHEPLPLNIPAIAKLQRELYDAQPRGKRHHLCPFFSTAIRRMEQADDVPGGDVNLTLAIDQLVPSVKIANATENEDSSSFYGLLVRLLPYFESTEDGCIWQHRLSFPSQAPRERHPTYGPYTNELADAHREYLTSVARLLDPNASDGFPAVVVEMSAEDRLRVDRVHHLSDWVITLDRFFGVEFYDDPSDPNLSRVAQKYLLDYAPEFLEGLGHRMLVTTAHREEVEELLARAMNELGFGMVEESVGEILKHLKTISGRLALRILGDDARAREAVSLGVVAAYLRARGELDDSILIPVDSHRELFGPATPRRRDGTPRARCDLVRVQFQRTRLVATFIEVKSRAAGEQSEELLNRIVDQIEATEETFRDLFFRKDPVRLDHVLQRSRLVNILRFYLRRARRYGLIKTEDRYREIESIIGRLESGIPDLRVERWGFIVNLAGKPQRPTKFRDTTIHFLTARDVVEAGLSAGLPEEVGPGGTLPTPTPFEIQPPKEGPEKHEPEPPPSPPTGPRPTVAHPLPVERPTCIAVSLGLTEGDQEPVLWRASVRGSPHLFILGIPGQGKSWTVTRILGDLARQGLPALVVDFHGQFADPSSPYAQSASPNVIDAAQGLPFSPFEADINKAAGTRFWKTNCFALAEIFQYVCKLGDIQRDVVYEAIRDCYRDLGFEEGNPERLPTIDEVRRRLEELERERGIKNVLPRCRPVMELGLFGEADVEPVDLQDLLRTGLVLDVHTLGLEAVQLAAGAFLLRKIYKDMFQWGETDRLRLAIVLDEAHRLARDITLPKLMKEGRKFGIVVVVASQGLADYHPDVVGNAGTKVVYRTNFPMSKKVAGFLRARKGYDLAAAIEQLDVGEAYVQTPEMQACARVRMHPLEV
jgi:hypothetical protein